MELGPGQEVVPIMDLGFDEHVAQMEKFDRGELKAEDVKEKPAAEKVTDPEPAPAKPAKEPEIDDKPEPKAAKPSEEIEDPDTGEKIDLRTREGKRIQKLIERTKQAEARTKQLERTAASLPAPKVEATVVEAKADASQPPDPSKFKTVDEYIQASVKYGVDTALAADRAAQQEVGRQREASARAQAIDAREAAFLKEHPTYREVLAEGLLPDLEAGLQMKHPTAIALKSALQSSPDGPQLAWLLAQNKGAEHARLAALPPEQALMELGKLVRAAELPKAREAKEEKRSSAPPPPEPVEGRTSASDPDPMNMDPDTHIAFHNRRDADASRARGSRRRSA